jgi:hypothetical protein
VWLIGTVWLVAAQPAESKDQRRTSVDDAVLAQDYVFAACLIKNYPGSPIAEEAEVWAGGLVEQGKVPADAYSKLAEIARNDSPEPTQSKSGKQMLMKSCLALYKNPAVRTKIRQLLRR